MLAAESVQVHPQNGVTDQRAVRRAASAGSGRRRRGEVPALARRAVIRPSRVEDFPLPERLQLCGGGFSGWVDALVWCAARSSSAVADAAQLLARRGDVNPRSHAIAADSDTARAASLPALY